MMRFASRRQQQHEQQRQLLVFLILVISFQCYHGWTASNSLSSFQVRSRSNWQHSQSAGGRKSLVSPRSMVAFNVTTATRAPGFDEYILIKDLEKQNEDHVALVQRVSKEVSLKETGDSTVEFTPSSPAAISQEADGPASPSTPNDAKPSSEVMKARLLLLGAAALYGTNFSLVKLMGEAGSMHMPVGLSTTLRFALAALATSPFLFMRANNRPATAQQLPTGATIASLSHNTFNKEKLMSVELGATLAGLEVGVWNSIGYIAQAIGLETTLASKSAFLCSMAVVVVPILDYLFAGKKLQAKQVTGVMLACVGVALLELGGATLGNPGEGFFSKGDLASMVQPIAFGVGFWRMEHAMHKYPEEARRSTASQLVAVFLCSAIYCYVADSQSIVEHWPQFQSWLHDPMIWLSLAWTGIVTTALTIYMETVALATLSAAETTLIFSSEPVSGAAFAAAIMGERFGVDAVLGAFLILGGCLFSNLGVDGIKQFLNVLTKRRKVDNKQKNHE